MINPLSWGGFYGEGTYTKGEVMENGIRIRNIIFEQLMTKHKCNRKHWEMLCSSDKPLVPFIGAGISAWCFPTWNDLLIKIVREKFSEDSAEIVKKALNCKVQPNVISKDKKPFYWMEEIAECIFDYDEKSYSKNEENFKLCDEDYSLKDEAGVAESRSDIQEAQLVYEKEEPFQKNQQKEAEIWESGKDEQKNLTQKGQTANAASDSNVPTEKQDPIETEKRKEADLILRQLRDNVGEESPQKKLRAMEALYQAFDSTLLKENRMPEYQKFFHRIFSDILVTTNYDRALECCYPSLFSYSYKNLNESFHKGDKDTKTNKDDVKSQTNDSWLFQVVKQKLSHASGKLNGQVEKKAKISVPNNPMLLKIHGSIEHVEEIALTASQYENVYNSQVIDLLKLIFERSTLIFIGSGLRKDRYMDQLKECREKKGSKVQHFAFLCISDKDDDENDRVKELAEYGIYPIFYAPDDLEELIPDEEERNSLFHDYFLGLFMENLSRRKMYYPQPLELLWDKERFEEKSLKEYLVDVRRKMLMSRSPQIVHRTEAQQIWNLLNYSDECPLIAVTGDTGSGRSALCMCIPELSRDYKDTMQFFYISLANCTRWDEFCLQIFEKMNIVINEMPEIEQWREVAQQVTERCSGYWRSVLILDRLDELKDKNNPGLWETIKKILWFWKEQQTRVIFTCKEYPEGISCYTWHIGKLEKEEARMVFFSACTSKRYRNISYLEKHAVSKLFSRQTFQPASAHLLGRYANSKNDLNSLLEEWKLYHQPGDNEQQILARILGNHLLAEHKYDEQDDKQKEKIKENILWVWGILDTYPGVFPSVFFQSVLDDEQFKKDNDIDWGLTGKTLRYMKNAGLCVESCDEQKSILLKNMVICVKKYFFEISDTNEEGKFSKLYDDFEHKLEESEERDSGLRCFRGYTMDNYDGGLRAYVLQEYGRKDKQYSEPNTDIRKILECLGKKVENDEGRKQNKDLNLVLHYEIKLVVRFLSNCLSKAEQDEEDQKKIADIGYCFSHYFHYIPNYAYPLAKQLLEILEHQEDKKMYQLANMNRVMGDIERLLGKKADSAGYYRKALQLCDNQMLNIFSMDSSSEELKQIANKCRRIRANALLISNDYDNLLQRKTAKKDDPLALFEVIHDVWGQAYYNQRMGEMLFDKIPELDSQDKEQKESNSILEEQKKEMPKIIDYYNNAAKLYMETGSKTGTAYILKCMGDLIEKFREVYKQGHYKLSVQDEKELYYKIERGDCEGQWEKDAVACYRQAFIYYYGHINWRGFANVIQAMGTTYRISCNGKINRKQMESVQTLYGLAEECYRWLGDVRGLADTLDYFGYACKDYDGGDDFVDSNGEEKNLDDKEYKHMALSKWMESKQMWIEQGNDQKANIINKEIQRLRSDLKMK